MQTSVVQRRQTSALAVAFGSVCASWVIAAGLSTLAWWNGPEGVPYSLLIAFACAATVLVSWGALRRRDGGSTVRAAAWPLLGWCPYLFGGAAVAIGEPIVVAHWRCGTGDMGLLMLALLSVPVVFALAIVSMLALDRARLGAVTRVGAWAAVGASLFFYVAGLARSQKATPDEYLASLPTVAALCGGDARFQGPGFSVEQRTERGPDGEASRCTIVAANDSRPIQGDCAGVNVKRDEAHDLWVFQASTCRAGRPDDRSWRHALHSGGAEFVEVRPSTVASALRPPTAWAASNAVGCLAGLALVAIASVLRRRAGEWRFARPGTHSGGGWVTFDDSTPPVHSASAAPIPEGPVLVLEPPRKTPHYREAGGIDPGARFTPGTLEELTLAARSRGTDLHAVAILVALVTLAPMIAAALAGLVF